MHEHTPVDFAFVNSGPAFRKALATSFYEIVAAALAALNSLDRRRQQRRMLSCRVDFHAKGGNVSVAHNQKGFHEHEIIRQIEYAAPLPPLFIADQIHTVEQA